MKLKGKFLKYWFPVVLYSGIIFYVSGLSNLKPPVEGPFSDKIWHVLEYLLYGFLMARALDHSVEKSKAGIFWLAIILSGLYGVSDEVHQLFVQGRFFSWLDIMADVIGGIIGVNVYFRLKEKRGKVT